MAITPLPPAPEPTDTPAEFNAKAFALVGALDEFVTETNATAVAADTDASTATTQAGIATTKAGEAVVSADLAEDWSIKTDGYVSGTDNSAKSWATGGTGTGIPSGGAAKDWATKTGGAVAGGEFSAKQYAQDSSDSADASEASAVEAAGLVENYQGALASDPALNKDGGALVAGDWYVNTSSGLIRAYNGAAWVSSVNVTAGVETFSAGTTGLTPNTGTQGDVTLAGTLAVANGGTGLTSAGTSGNILTSDGTTWESAAPPSSAVNYPQNIQSANYTLVLSDAGKQIFHPSADTTARTFTIPANASVAYPIGTVLKFINQNGAGEVTIDITTDTLRRSPEASTYAPILVANGSATAIKVTSTEWLISGTGLIGPIPGEIGSAYQGGFYAGQISVAGNGIASHYLVVGPVASAQNDSKQWKTTTTTTAGTTSVIDGPTNSSNMNDASHPAAQFCEGLTIGGYTDWYMPARNELELGYYNLKPTTASNTTSHGTNTNAVPSRGSNYISGNPSRTSATDFQDAGAEAFINTGRYWSSTQSTSTAAWGKRFFNGADYSTDKTSSAPVRAFRRVAV